MKQKSLIKNIFYNFIYTGINLLYPLITAPYISRILGASNLGEVNLATTIVNWFILFAVFGTTTYGVREVAKIRDNRQQLNKLFSEIIIINGILSFIVTAIFYITIFNIDKLNSEYLLYMILSISIILNIFSIDWFFQAIEEYKYITIRNALIKIFSLVCIFLFVQEEEHYIIYGLISVIATSLNGVLNFIYSKKYVKLQFKNINPMRHIKSLSVFFMHTFVVNIYTNADQVLLGFLIDTKSVAFMNRTKMITSLAISLSTAITNVTLPRASYYIKNDIKKFKQLLNVVSNYILWITVPISLGCICLASNIMYILGGKEFLDATFLLQIMSLTIIFAPLSTYLQYQVLVAAGKEKLGLYCAIITSILSLILNIILIPSIGFIGTGITQTLSQILAVLLRYYIAKGKLDYKEISFINKSTISYLSAALLMCGIVIYIKLLISNLFISFVVGLIVGALVYFITLVLLKEKVMLSVLGKIRKRNTRS
ncbi:flippase [Marinilactibacillus psychrotolerans]|uniref:flippase n=1 Tax=Marinilactibacillus psychrotolerans TaxID=191770 RepID=UPI003883879A